MSGIIPRSFYARDTRKVAQNLLGKILSCRTPEGTAKGRIVETEAYYGNEDPASHAYRGKTSRSNIMWGRPGVAYVYFVYGMHHMLNVVTEEKGTPGAVLVRALEPVEGIELMKKRRKTQNIKNLTNSPGRLTQALGITTRDNGVDLVGSHLWIEKGRPEKFDIVSTGRIGIKVGKNLKLRFYIKGDGFDYFFSASPKKLSAKSYPALRSSEVRVLSSREDFLKAQIKETTSRFVFSLNSRAFEATV